MKNYFPLIMKAAALITGLIFAVFGAACAMFHRGWLLTFAITFGTTCYHFSMRLLIGWLVPRRFDPQSPWFQPKKFEQPLYRYLKLRRWKHYLPTYNPQLFFMTENTPEQIVRNMCHAEVVHLCIVAASFLPLLGAIPWGSFPVFLITSLISAGFDLLFVAAQRYNRPRVLRMMKMQQHKNALRGTHE